MNIAHRGFSSKYPENTLLSFRKALELGVPRIELDLQVTRDGRLVVLHDLTVDRTTDGSGAASDLTFDQIRALDAGGWLSPEFAEERVPSFEEVLDFDASAILVVELKFEGDEAIPDVLRLIRDHGAVDRTVISSFHLEKLPIVREIAPEIPTTALLAADGSDADGWIDRGRQLGVDTIGPRCTEITPDRVRALHNAGFAVRAWGLGRDQGPEMRRIIEAGVDGMTTDCPDILQRILQEEAS